MHPAYTLAKLKQCLTALQSAVSAAVDWEGETMFRPDGRPPVLMPDGEVRSLTWGIHRSFVPNIHMIKSAALKDKAWQACQRRGRCVIPMSTYFEVREDNGCGPIIEVSSPDEELVWVAAIWDVTQRTPKRFALLTLDHLATPDSPPLPAFLTETDARAYLEGGLDALSIDPAPLAFSQSPGALRSGGGTNG